ncbi:MAG: Stealth CR1 domain-containing protein [Flavobacteriaceae bacterium]
MSIDAVIAWVDGQDPNHFARRIGRQKELQLPISENLSSSRYESNFEINYCVLSILKYAPFVNKIFIVTDQQNPDILEDCERNFPGSSERITIVDHKEIFPDYLPNFNSLSIATTLSNIKGLSDRYIYFNDDVLLIKPTKEKDFFQGERPVLRGDWKVNSFYRNSWNFLKTIIKKGSTKNYQPRVSFHLTQWTAAKLAGFKLRFWSNSHTPHPLNKKVLSLYFKEHPKEYHENIRHPFRVNTQFSAIALNNNLEKRKYNNNFTAPIQAEYIKYRREKQYIEKKIKKLRSPGNTDLFLCIQNIDAMSSQDRELLFSTLDQLIAPVYRNE